jgi:hypothetical protein
MAGPYRRGTRRTRLDWKAYLEIAFITIVGTLVLLSLASR